MNCAHCDQPLLVIDRDQWTLDFHCFRCGRSWAEHVGIDDFGGNAIGTPEAFFAALAEMREELKWRRTEDGVCGDCGGVCGDCRK